MRLKISIAAVFLFGLAGYAQPQASKGAIKHFEKFESKLVQPRSVDVWLPPDFDKNEKYPVLYMHDGQMLFDPKITWNGQAWEVDNTAARLMEQGQVRKFIVVGIWNVPDLRFSDYFPQKPFESLTQKTKDSLYAITFGEKKLFNAKVNADNYLKFIVTELKPFIDSNFPTKTDAANTFIAGSSMGGLISLYGICEYPNVFGGAACMSTHWIGTMEAGRNPIPMAFLKYLDRKLPPSANHKIYFDYGSAGLDANYGPTQKKVDGIMSAHGYKSGSWMTKEFRGEDHSEKSWATRLYVPLEFLFGYPKTNLPKLPGQKAETSPVEKKPAADAKAASANKTTPKSKAASKK